MHDGTQLMLDTLASVIIGAIVAVSLIAVAIMIIGA